MKYFWTVVVALSVSVALVVFLVASDASETTSAIVRPLLVLAVAAVAAGGLRAVVHLTGRRDLSPEDKRIWLMWLWLGTPIAVPLYLRRSRL